MRVKPYGSDGRLPGARIAAAAEVADGGEWRRLTRQEAVGEKRRLLENGGRRRRQRRRGKLSGGERSCGLAEELEGPEGVNGARFRHFFFPRVVFAVVLVL